MKIRFKIDQADMFRRGIDAPKSIVTLEVNPADIAPDKRELIARHMRGIDVVFNPASPRTSYLAGLVMASDQTIESLCEALNALDESEERYMQRFGEKAREQE